jgi:PKD repeat protein
LERPDVRISHTSNIVNIDRFGDDDWSTYAEAPANEASSITLSLNENDRGADFAFATWKIGLVDSTGKPCGGARLKIWLQVLETDPGTFKQVRKTVLLGATDSSDGRPIFTDWGFGYLSGQQCVIPHSISETTNDNLFPEDYLFYSIESIRFEVVPDSNNPPPPGARVRYYGASLWIYSGDDTAKASPEQMGIPPIPRISGPEKAFVSSVVTFTASGSFVLSLGRDPWDPELITRYTWAVRDPSGVESIYESTSRDFEFTPSTVGTYVITLRAFGTNAWMTPYCDAVRLQVVSPEGGGGSSLVAEANGPYFTYRNTDVVFSSVGTSGAVSYLWEFGDGSVSTQANPTHSYVRQGTYIVKLTVWDSSGNQATDLTAVVVRNRAPTAVIAGPTVGYTGYGITFSGSGSSDPDGDPLVYSWNFSDIRPGIGIGGSGSGSEFYVVFFSPGTKQAKLVVRDPFGGRSEATTQITIYKSNPIAEANGPYTGPVGGIIQFWSIGSRSPDDCYPLKYRWEFGDGTVSEGEPNPTHVYAASGTYTVTLTVWDSEGYFASDTAQVYIYGSTHVENPDPTGVSLEPLDLKGALWDDGFYYFLPRWMALYYRNDTVLGRFLLNFAPMLSRLRFEVGALEDFARLDPKPVYKHQMWITSTEGVTASGEVTLLLGSKSYPVRLTRSLWDFMTASDPVFMVSGSRMLFRNLLFVEESLVSEDGTFELSSEPIPDEDVWCRTTSGWIRIPSGSDLRSSGTVTLRGVNSGTFRYQSLSAGSPQVRIGRTVLVPELIDIWTPIDELALLFDMSRTPGLGNQELLERLRTRNLLRDIWSVGASFGLGVSLSWNGVGELDLSSLGLTHVKILGLPEYSEHQIELVPSSEPNTYFAPPGNWEPGWYLACGHGPAPSYTITEVGSQRFIQFSRPVLEPVELRFLVKNYTVEQSGGLVSKIVPTSYTPSGDYRVLGVRSISIWSPLDHPERLYDARGLPTSEVYHISRVSEQPQILFGRAVWGRAHWFSSEEVLPQVSMLSLAFDEVLGEV